MPVMSRLIASSVLVMTAVLLAPRTADACSCVESGAACEEYWKASAVFRARVESIARQAVKPPMRLPASRRVTLVVLEAFSGVPKGTVEIVTGSGGGDCGFPFREGAEYVVYARRSDPGAPLTVSICSRTREVAQAESDLEYFRAIESGAPVPSRISGQVQLATRSLGRGPVREPRPLQDVGVRLEQGGQSTRVVTDPAGRFVAEGLAAGRYTASLELTDGLYAEGWPKTIDLADARGCAEVRATAYADGRVSGRAVDAAGRPVVGLTVELTVPAGLDESPGPERLRDLTDGEGRYEIVHVPAGRFVVGINTERDREGRELEPRYFHPGVAVLTGATRVMLRPGERVALPDFKLPRDVVFVAVSGLVLDPDGAPAPGARVYLKGQADVDYILSEPAITDASGRFTLAAVAGRPYRLFAERSRDDGSVARIDSSEQVPLTASAAAPPFKLTLRRRY